ncbi:shikimate dehydrogenase [Ferriphaselus sp. R-1]|uniref:shikimate dehydrogenase n=1 Tax=Ferriphaselus sp. R-1 TaxID=1485544 RepID=UPI000554572B|nr:shikimate dehydrogenase [Ferriphaselus sp. R-1]
MTDRYAVIGHPISHSKSPLIHRMFAKQTGQDISYEAIEAPLDGFAATIERLRKEGYKGCNVTVPFKFEAFNRATDLSERARSAQAVNTLRFKNDLILGDNTDGAGLVRDIEHNQNFPLSGKRVLLMGAGGAAYGVALPLISSGASLTVSNRTHEKAVQLARHLQAHGVVEVLDVKASSVATPFDCIINATSVGLTDDLPELPEGVFHAGSLAYDMVYSRETKFMALAKSNGVKKIADGLGMLVEQAAEAFFIWRGVRPDTAPVLAALRG